MKVKQFAIMQGTERLALVEASDKFLAMREFRTLYRNTWVNTDPMKLSVIPVSKKILQDNRPKQ